MKILYIILSIFILAISSQGCCGEDNCEDEVSQTQNGKNHHNDSCEGSCCPFFSCGSCVGFTFPSYTFSVPDNSFVFIETNLVSTYIPELQSQFKHAIWQPPKIS
ncbi:hypothetical protein [Flavobacterium ovatum]|uniref:hypothetical protein n=1 Tax=Flavobacterium ovatum TaxID=1928857 RepID=UPI00344C1298